MLYPFLQSLLTWVNIPIIIISMIHLSILHHKRIILLHMSPWQHMLLFRMISLKPSVPYGTRSSPMILLSIHSQEESTPSVIVSTTQIPTTQTTQTIQTTQVPSTPSQEESRLQKQIYPVSLVLLQQPILVSHMQDDEVLRIMSQTHSHLEVDSQE